MAERNASGRFVSSGNTAGADRKPETTVEAIQREIKARLDKGDLTPSELASLSRTFKLIERQGPTTSREQQDAEADAMIALATPDELEKLRAAWREQFQIENRLRVRAGKPVVPHYFGPPSESTARPLDYLLTMIGRREESFLQVLNEFLDKHNLHERFGADMEEAFSQCMKGWFDRTGLLNDFCNAVAADLDNREGH